MLNEKEFAEKVVSIIIALQSVPAELAVERASKLIFEIMTAAYKQGVNDGCKECFERFKGMIGDACSY